MCMWKKRYVKFMISISSAIVRRCRSVSGPFYVFATNTQTASFCLGRIELVSHSQWMDADIFALSFIFVCVVQISTIYGVETTRFLNSTQIYADDKSQGKKKINWKRTEDEKSQWATTNTTPTTTTSNQNKMCVWDIKSFFFVRNFSGPLHVQMPRRRHTMNTKQNKKKTMRRRKISCTKPGRRAAHTICGRRTDLRILRELGTIFRQAIWNFTHFDIKLKKYSNTQILNSHFIGTTKTKRHTQTRM